MEVERGRREHGRKGMRGDVDVSETEMRCRDPGVKSFIQLVTMWKVSSREGRERCTNSWQLAAIPGGCCREVVFGVGGE